MQKTDFNDNKYIKKSGYVFNLLIILFILFSSFFQAKAQRTDLEAGLMNVGLGSIIGGLGAIINKEPDKKMVPVLLKGMGSGALGGYFIFEGKRLIRSFSKDQDYAYIWPSKILSSAGSSIIENAAANRVIWERWHMNMGFNRIELTTGEKIRLRYRIMPFSLGGTIVTATRGKFDLDKTLKTGQLIFIANSISSEDLDGNTIYGQVPLFANSILILDTWEGDAALAHELIHVYQNESFVGINSLLEKSNQKLMDKSSFYRGYSKIFYTDFHIALVGGLYNLEHWRQGYTGNIFEEEAFYFTGREMKNPSPPVLFGKN